MIQVKNGQVIKTRLPKSGTLNGRLVSGYDRLPESVLKEQGWLPEVKKEPEYDKATERLKFDKYEILKTQVNAVYVAELIPGPTPDPLQELQTKVSKLESDITELKTTEAVK